MTAASRYWTLVRIDAAGKRKIEEIASAKAFFLAAFPDCIDGGEVPDAQIQRQLLQWMREATNEGVDLSVWPEGEAKDQSTADELLKSNANKRYLAELCLQCFVSHQIARVCQQLEIQFGVEHGFTSGDLLARVLDFKGKKLGTEATTPVKTSYQSLPDDILQSFDPEQSSLATWTTRRVKHNRDLNDFLLEHGVYLVSDWAILNDTTPKQLQRIFFQFHQLTPVEIEQAKQLLESYHAVYRASRLKARQQGIKGQCLPPTTAQLQQMQQRLSTQSNQMLRPETLMSQLQEIASRLRQYRIHVRGGSLPTESLDVTNPGAPADPSLDLIDNRNSEDEPTEFLKFYRQQFLICLDGAIEQVISERVTLLQRRDAQKAQNFLTALQLFHCQGRSMTEIAKALNLQAQFHVSRLLKLKDFRADIRQQLLVRLRDRVLNQAKTYTDATRLHTLNQQIEEALDEQITAVIQEAATEASTATITKNQLTTSLFAQRLCRHLDTRRN